MKASSRVAGRVMWVRALGSNPVLDMRLIREDESADEACLRDTVKLRRARGGCLGAKRRRRTWTAAKSFGELLTSVDPEVSESGNRP
jgi:hypothetical protein